MNPETKVEHKACALIYEHLGITGSKLSTPGTTGYPDRIFWLPGGAPVLVEFKKPGGVLSKAQADRVENLKILEYAVYVCDDAPTALSILIEHARAVSAKRFAKGKISFDAYTRVHRMLDDAEKHAAH